MSLLAGTLAKFPGFKLDPKRREPQDLSLDLDRSYLCYTLKFPRFVYIASKNLSEGDMREFLEK